MDERLYEERRNANLPFGYWLVVDDEEGSVNCHGKHTHQVSLSLECAL